MTDKQISRYNELLLKFIQDDDFHELLYLTNNYFLSMNIVAKKDNNLFIDNPYERLVYDLENREKMLKEGGNK